MTAGGFKHCPGSEGSWWVGMSARESTAEAGSPGETATHRTRKLQILQCVLPWMLAGHQSEHGSQRWTTNAFRSVRHRHPVPGTPREES